MRDCSKSNIINRRTTAEHVREITLVARLEGSQRVPTQTNLSTHAKIVIVDRSLTRNNY